MYYITYNEEGLPVCHLNTHLPYSQDHQTQFRKQLHMKDQQFLRTRRDRAHWCERALLGTCTQPGPELTCSALVPATGARGWSRQAAQRTRGISHHDPGPTTVIFVVFFASYPMEEKPI